MSNARDAFRFGDIFTDHMVLQRDCMAAVWGYGPASSSVTLHFAGRVRRGLVGQDGRWVIRFDPGSACSSGRELRVALSAASTTSPGQVIAISDVLVGDVWFCAGQSNMELGLASAEDGAAEAAQANYPLIRLLLIHKTSAPVPIRTIAARWQRCMPETIVKNGWGGFSAVAYYFGRRVHETTGVPVGLIQSAYGGSKIHPFIHPACMNGHPDLDRFGHELQSADHDWRRALAQAGLPVPEQLGDQGYELHPFSPYTEWDVLKPATVWNAMVHPLLPFALRGVLWYQGESDVGSGASYVPKMRALVRGFRRSFEDRALPVYFAQIAPWAYDHEADLLDFWLAQYQAARMPNTAMVTTVDLGDLVDIHPVRKQPVGERFAALALSRLYGHTDLPWHGPTLRSLRFRRKRALLHFVTFSRKGLSTLDGRPPHGFALAGADGVFHHAKATIAGETVRLTCPAVPSPRWIRHAWNVDIGPNLSDASGIPALPFRLERPVASVTGRRQRARGAIT